MQGNGSNGSNGNGHSNSNGHSRKPYVARLRPRPRLPSEYAQQLITEHDQLLAGISFERKPTSLISRLEKLIEVIDADDEAIPVQLEEDEDSLVTKVDAALNKSNGHR